MKFIFFCGTKNIMFRNFLNSLLKTFRAKFSIDLDDLLADLDCGLKPTKHFLSKSYKCLVHSGFQHRYEWYRKNIN